MANLGDLRVSKVEPAVEDSLGQLVDMVKQLGRRGGDLTESQNRRMVSYLGNLDDMREQIVVMVQRYEDDWYVLKRLLDLIDRIDEVKNLASASAQGFPIVEEAPSPSDKELARQYDTPFNPLMVSEVGLLDASGLYHDAEAAAAAREEENDEEDGPDGADFWDHEDDDPNQFAPEEDLVLDLTTINLSASSAHLPSSIPPPLSSSQIPSSSSSAPAPPSQHPLPSQHPIPSSQHTHTTSRRYKGKGKGRRESHSASESESASETESVSQESSDSSDYEGIEQGNPNKQRRVNRHQRIPTPPPLPPSRQTKTQLKSTQQRRNGPCDPVLCKICYEEYRCIEFLYGFSECGHQYCRECLAEYLTANILEGAVLDLTCPFPNCETEVLPRDIKKLCIPEIFTKYERFTVIASLRMDPNARWCPNPECNNGIKADPNSKWVYCDACKLEFCFHCMSEKHVGFECGKEALEFLEKKKASEIMAHEKFIQFAEEFKAKMKACPSCKAYIEKNDGCNHMTCGNQSCRAQFCWLCLRLYSPDHFSNDIEYPECYDKQYWNPMQDLYNNYAIPYTPPRRNRISNVAKKVGIYMGLGVAVVTLGVPAAVIGGPVYGCFRLHKRLQARRRDRARANAYYNPDFAPPSPARIAEAQREVARLRALEAEAFPRRR